MPTKRPKVVIIGAGMAGITAANRLYKSGAALEICVVEGGARIGGRINTSEFAGDRIEMGATWIHGIKGSPVHKIAQEINSMDSDQPWECMDSLDEPVTVAEGGLELGPDLTGPVSSLFKKLMDFAQGKAVEEDDGVPVDCKSLRSGKGGLGPYLRSGLAAYWESGQYIHEEGKMAAEEAVFAMHENTQRTYTSAGDLNALDYNAESEYIMFPGEEVTIAKGYLSVVNSLASVLPAGVIQLGRKVVRIEWQQERAGLEGSQTRPVVLHFHDGSTMMADHVVVTVSLGVLKQGIRNDVGNCGLFSPQLPPFKTEAISKLGYGLVNKLFLQLREESDDGDKENQFPNLQLAFRRNSKSSEIPWWMRKTATLAPIYSSSRVLLSWFAGEEALQLESMDDDDILAGVSSTLSKILPESGTEISKVLKSRWGSDPLFLGSYSYVAVGSSGDDLDALAEPLPKQQNAAGAPPLQILFAGEATHRTHYSTTHGAYYSGLREADRLLQHYNFSSDGGGGI